MTWVLQGEEKDCFTHWKILLRKGFAAFRVSCLFMTWKFYMSHRCVVPLPRQVFWLRWVGHPGRATVWGWRWHDKVVWVTRTVGWYSVHCCYWVSCERWEKMDLAYDFTYIYRLHFNTQPLCLTWVGGDGLVNGDSREGGPGQRQVRGAVVLLGLQVWRLRHTRLQANIRSGTASGEEGHMLTSCTGIR